MANFNLLPPVGPSAFAAKIIFELYEHREEIIDSYRESAEAIIERAKPAVDASVELFHEASDFMKKFISDGGLLCGRSNHLLTFVKDPPKNRGFFF